MSMMYEHDCIHNILSLGLKYSDILQHHQVAFLICLGGGGGHKKVIMCNSTMVIAKIKEMPRSLFLDILRYVTMG